VAVVTRQHLVEVRLWEEAVAGSRFFRTRYTCESANIEKIWKFSSVLSINFFVSDLHNCRSGQSLQLANVTYFFELCFIEFATMTQHGDRGWWNRTNVPIDLSPFIAHPAHERLYHTTGVYAPYSLRTAVWVFLRPTRIRTVKELWHGPTVFRSYPRRLECLAICRCHSRDSTLFSSVILRPWVLVRPGFEPATSCSADRRLTSWANRTAALWHYVLGKKFQPIILTNVRKNIWRWSWLEKRCII